MLMEHNSQLDSQNVEKDESSASVVVREYRHDGIELFDCQLNDGEF